MKKSYLYIFILLMGLMATACSKDDEGPSESASSSLKINGKGIEKVLSAVCEEGSLSGDNWLSFSSILMFEGDMVSFSLEGEFSSANQLKSGQDVTDYLDVSRLYVMSGNDNSGIGLDGSSNSRYYSIESGRVTVLGVSSSKVDLKFKNLVISKEIGNSSKTFTLSGSLTYTLN